ncbi:hypothetical protein G7Y89_g6363 [Cudoniella acicularis]|uniref:Uncharacterized protein n=1 Tax=Cudoniella acicularis TaxID=354080 RepID=A0A8H4RN33_9HELO|nr:hypothetical protein G7Y89_g6363 [Cudoniella acicularis]
MNSELEYSIVNNRFSATELERVTSGKVLKFAVDAESLKAEEHGSSSGIGTKKSKKELHASYEVWCTYLGSKIDFNVI